MIPSIMSNKRGTIIDPGRSMRCGGCDGTGHPLMSVVQTCGSCGGYKRDINGNSCNKCLGQGLVSITCRDISLICGICMGTRIVYY